MSQAVISIIEQVNQEEKSYSQVGNHNPDKQCDNIYIYTEQLKLQLRNSNFSSYCFKKKDVQYKDKYLSREKKTQEAIDGFVLRPPSR